MEKTFVVGMACLLALSLVGCYEYRGPYTKADVEEYLTGKYPDEQEAVQKALEDSVKKYYAFYRLPCWSRGRNQLNVPGTGNRSQRRLEH